MPTISHSSFCVRYHKQIINEGKEDLRLLNSTQHRKPFDQPRSVVAWKSTNAKVPYRGGIQQRNLFCHHSVRSCEFHNYSLATPTIVHSESSDNRFMFFTYQRTSWILLPATPSPKMETTSHLMHFH